MVPSPRVSQLQDASMLLWAFKWGFGSDFVYAFAKANACCVELKIAQIAERAVSSTHTQHIIQSFFKVKIACVGFQGEGGKDMHTQYNIQIIR